MSLTFSLTVAHFLITQCRRRLTQMQRQAPIQSQRTFRLIILQATLRLSLRFGVVLDGILLHLGRVSLRPLGAPAGNLPKLLRGIVLRNGKPRRGIVVLRNGKLHRGIVGLKSGKPHRGIAGLKSGKSRRGKLAQFLDKVAVKVARVIHETRGVAAVAKLSVRHHGINLGGEALQSGPLQ